MRQGDWGIFDQLFCFVFEPRQCAALFLQLRVERGDSRAPAMGITVWDGQSILFSNPEGGSDLLSLKLSLENPAPLHGVSMSDDPFVE